MKKLRATAKNLFVELLRNSKKKILKEKSAKNNNNIHKQNYASCILNKIVNSKKKLNYEKAHQRLGFHGTPGFCTSVRLPALIFGVKNLKNVQYTNY